MADSRAIHAEIAAYYRSFPAGIRVFETEYISAAWARVEELELEEGYRWV